MLYVARREETRVGGCRLDVVFCFSDSGGSQRQVGFEEVKVKLWSR